MWHRISLFLSLGHWSILQPAEDIHFNWCKSANNFLNSSCAESKVDMQCKLFWIVWPQVSFTGIKKKTLMFPQNESVLADMIHYLPASAMSEKFFILGIPISLHWSILHHNLALMSWMYSGLSPKLTLFPQP